MHMKSQIEKMAYLVHFLTAITFLTTRPIFGVLTFQYYTINIFET